MSALQSQSLIYRHIWIYRFVVNLLFLGRYNERFERAKRLLDPEKDKRVVELCFGDVHIAEWCRKHGVDYFGMDLNPRFVRWARNRGYNVIVADLRDFPVLERSDVVIIMGSLYHFHDILSEVVNWVMASSRRLIITEPIKNLANRNDIWGRIARKSANAGRGEEEFRYDERTLREALKKVSGTRYEYSFAVVEKEAVVELKWTESAS